MNTVYIGSPKENALYIFSGQNFQSVRKFGGVSPSGCAALPFSGFGNSVGTDKFSDVFAIGGYLTTIGNSTDSDGAIFLQNEKSGCLSTSKCEVGSQNTLSSIPIFNNLVWVKEINNNAYKRGGYAKVLDPGYHEPFSGKNIENRNPYCDTVIWDGFQNETIFQNGDIVEFTDSLNGRVNINKYYIVDVINNFELSGDYTGQALIIRDCLSGENLGGDGDDGGGEYPGGGGPGGGGTGTGCFVSGLIGYIVEAIYINDFKEAPSICGPASNISGINSIEIVTPYSPANFIAQEAPDFSAFAILPSLQASPIDVYIQTVLKPGGTPLIDISSDNISFDNNLTLTIPAGELSGEFFVRITGELPPDNPLTPGFNEPGEIFLEASVPTDLSYDPSLTLLTIYAGGPGNGESSPCGGAGHVCNRATFDIIFGTGIGTGADPNKIEIINGVTVLQANLNNNGGPTDPGPGPFPYDGPLDRYSYAIITEEMSEQILGPTHKDGTEKSYFIEIRPSEDNPNPHGGITNVRVRNPYCSGLAVYNCCLSLGGGSNSVPPPSAPVSSSLSFVQVLDTIPDYVLKSLDDIV
jgi:hypothetical protein